MAAPLMFAARAQFMNMQAEGLLWKLSVTTGDSGTNCRVFVDIYGEEGNTGDIELGNPDGNFFQPGTTSDFAIKLPKEVGKVYKMRVSHDNSGDSNSWTLNQITMFNMTGMMLFKCERFLSPTEDDKQFVRELPCLRPGEEPLPVKRYELDVKTGREKGAGTKATVRLMLVGEKSDTGPRIMGKHNFLNDREDEFKKGRTAKFFIEAVDLGPITKIEVSHDGDTKKMGWYLQHILVKEDGGPSYFFAGDTWLCKERGDGVTSRELTRTGIFDDSDEGEDDDDDEDEE
ncbi:lipoxygenase homology domain-containing protein 1-like [Ptychodera flava]|uniref:lipoxygenase homology domain-containing protein 1-like n=1 Tax=Ptychodera flava TaxID=63121 RepID=UPI00396A8D67